MRRIKSSIDPQSSEFRTFQRQNHKRMDTLHKSHQKARFDRPERDIKRLRAQKKIIGSGAY